MHRMENEAGVLVQYLSCLIGLMRTARLRARMILHVLGHGLCDASIPLSDTAVFISFPPSKTRIE